MIRLTEITEDNWLEAAGLSVSDEQKKYVDILMANSFSFYVRYTLLWMYRDLKKKKKGLRFS